MKFISRNSDKVFVARAHLDIVLARVEIDKMEWKGNVPGKWVNKECRWAGVQWIF